MNDFVAYSGGTDSTGLLLMMPDAVPVFTDTGWEHDELYAAIDRFEQVTGREVIRVRHPDHPGGLPQYIREKKFLPSVGARYCTRIFKIEAMNLWLEDHLPATLNIALRADEPPQERAGNLTQMEGLAIRYPLREWGMTRIDCVRACLEHNLLPRFPVYMARGGCKGCFFKRKSEVLALRELDRPTYDELSQLEQAIQDKRNGHFAMFRGLGMTLQEFDRQPALFDMDDTWRDVSEDIPCGLFCHR